MATSKPLMNREQMALVWKLALADYIRGLRIDKGMTQADLADAIGVRNFQFISGIENARQSVPSDRQAALAEALGVNLVEFSRTVLRYQDPWTYASIFGADAQLRSELKVAPDRLNRRRGVAPL